MTTRPDTDSYRELFLRDIPMMDVRSPGEFTHGAFPNACSLPLMTDEERAQVGICYRQQGQRAAIELGHRLVAGERKAERLARWSAFARANPDGYVYCFRGGLRSSTVQLWLREAGVDYPLVLGGYKAMRKFLLDELEQSVAHSDLLLISGRTGTGKTRVITRLTRSIDLEGLAGHRGSTFGQLPEPQPSQIDFENALSIALMKLLAHGEHKVILEDEGRLVGRLHLPDALREKMKSSPMALVEETLEERVNVIVEDYVVDLGRRFIALYGDAGGQHHANKLQHDLSRIRKRLGGERYQRVSELMTAAFSAQASSGDLGLHREWIARLLQQYYDPMYDYQLGERSGEVVFRGRRDAVVEFANNH